GRPHQEVLRAPHEGPDARHQARNAVRADHHQAGADQAPDRDPEGKGGPSMIAQLAAAIAILTGPSGLTNDPTPPFTVDGGGAALEGRVDAQAWTPCEDRFTADELSDGGHVFRVRSGADSAFRSFTVDTLDPQVAIDGEGDLHMADTTATLTFSA